MVPPEGVRGLRSETVDDGSWPMVMDPSGIPNALLLRGGTGSPGGARTSIGGHDLSPRLDYSL